MKKAGIRSNNHQVLRHRRSVKFDSKMRKRERKYPKTKVDV